MAFHKLVTVAFGRSHEMRSGSQSRRFSSVRTLAAHEGSLTDARCELKVAGCSIVVCGHWHLVADLRGDQKFVMAI